MKGKRTKMIKKYGRIMLLLICLLVIFQIYLYTMFPAFKMDDSPETIIAAQTLGISHAPGYPLFSLCAKIFSLLPAGSPAFKTNVFAGFLALLVLAAAFLLMKFNLSGFLGYKGTAITITGVFMLAFSFMFWSQAIEAKGGIYMLNLLFLTALIFVFLKLNAEFKPVYLYLLFYMYGLALTNHWPSVIILMPVAGYYIIRYVKKITAKNILFSFLLLIIGMSVYLYLPIRAVNDPVMNTGNPVTLKDFLWLVLRAGYSAAPAFPNSGQINEYIKLFSGDFSWLGIFSIAGIYALWKKNAKALFLYSVVFAIVFLMVILFNRYEERPAWAVDVF
jgi:hypothetical protein